MVLKLGPVLRFRGYDAASKTWNLSALIATDRADPAPEISFTDVGAVKINTGQLIDTWDNGKAWRVDLPFMLGLAARSVTYNIVGDASTFTIQLPAQDQMPRMAYASCNGFSDPKVAKKISNINGRWEHLKGQHDNKPFHLLLLGGDQIYSDSMWAKDADLHAFSDLSDAASYAAPFPITLRDRLTNMYFDEFYCKRWGQVAVRDVLARVPTVMIWDDHDIMDGWGSYEHSLQSCDVYRGIFSIAKRAFTTFQMQGCATDGQFISQANGFSHYHRIGDLGILALDMRSERSQEQVMSPAHWTKVYNFLAAEKNLSHLILMSSIPVVHARFSMVESLLGWLPGRQELEDDLKDHWSSRSHLEERKRLIHRLLAFSAAEKTRVTIISGDVHLAASGTIVSTQAGSVAITIPQLTSSAIVHPGPPGIMQFAMNQLFDTEEDVDDGIVTRMDKMPSSEKRFIAARNWLALEPDDRPGITSDRLWASWHVEGEKYPYTRVIQVVS